ncbi:MAG: D-alanyl-D-alanine carboxypeptidase, partial [Rhizobiales bacterium]|nr:D-alanyl-D-alanine carboxypeptidase [Hyphomicrobiales bacterium]
MYCVSVGASSGLRWVLLSLASIVAFVAVAADPADARTWRKKRSADSVIADARYADIVVDVNSGETLHEANAEGLRYPASLTKIMTLYLLFERLEAGKIKLDTPLKVSATAVEQAPSKLGLDAGDTIEVEDAIKALVTKSANDVAVVVAEALAGSEENFAKLMTRKARALAMKYTVYKNASGLPDEDQVTTARDQALLGIAIQERFPRYYRYFSTPNFSYRGHSMRNHNNLLGRIDGVDGIKTGYTRASGFNLVTSVRRGSRQIVAVVLGGKSSSKRDARMRELIETKIASASQRRTKTKLADADPITENNTKPTAPPPAAKHAAKPEAKSEKKPEPKKNVAVTTSTSPAPQLQPGSTDPIQPRLVKTFSVKAGATQTASLETIALSPSHAIGVSPSVNRAADENIDKGAPPSSPAGARSGALGVLTVKSQGAVQPGETAPV